MDLPDTMWWERRQTDTKHAFYRTFIPSSKLPKPVYGVGSQGDVGWGWEASGDCRGAGGGRRWAFFLIRMLVLQVCSLSEN